MQTYRLKQEVSTVTFVQVTDSESEGAFGNRRLLSPCLLNEASQRTSLSWLCFINSSCLNLSCNVMPWKHLLGKPPKILSTRFHHTSNLCLPWSFSGISFCCAPTQFSQWPPPLHTRTALLSVSLPSFLSILYLLESLPLPFLNTGFCHWPLPLYISSLAHCIHFFDFNNQLHYNIPQTLIFNPDVSLVVPFPLKISTNISNTSYSKTNPLCDFYSNILFLDVVSYFVASMQAPKSSYTYSHQALPVFLS